MKEFILEIVIPLGLTIGAGAWCCFIYTLSAERHERRKERRSKK